MHSLGLILTFAVTMAAISNCRISSLTTAPPETVRLVGGSRSSEGRVEVLRDGQWGTVCNNLWTLREANVVCRQLGYVGADRVFISWNKFGYGVGEILLDMVQCDGTEQDLFDCPRGVNNGPECSHNEDVGVECTTTNSVRLADGASYSQGRLEMFDDNDQWGTVCAQEWDREETRVACKQLGRTAGDDLEWFTADPGSGPIVIGGLQCTGNEDRLDNCTQDADWTPGSCDQSGHSQDIGVQCSPDILLEVTGLVLVVYGGAGGTVCPDNWDANAASVACRNLGHKGVIERKTVEDNFYLYRDIILRNTICSGNETFFTECESVEWAYQGDCSREIAAAVICERQEPEARIVSDSIYPEIGRVEISLSDPDNFMAICTGACDIEDAHVVCRQLGYSDGAAQVFSVEHDSEGDHVITDLDCPDGSSNLTQCSIETKDVESAENCDLVAAVVCFVPYEDSLVPLVSGRSTSEGVLEYKISGLPALICDPDWSEREATVACRMHGYETGNDSEVVHLAHSRDSFPVSFKNYNFTCSGAEASLAECYMEPMEAVDGCNPDDVVQVTCQPNKDWDLRLVGSTASEQGRVEVFLGGEWGSVIYDSTPVPDFFRDELCQQLGYKKHLYKSFDLAGGNNPFGEGTGKVLKCQFPFPSGCDDVLREVSEDEPRNDVSVVCIPYDTVENHPVRLVSETGVANNQTGRVEILHDGEWNAVCDLGYYKSVHAVVCRELVSTDVRYAALLTGEDREPFLTGDEKIWFATDLCSTSRLYTCPHGPWGYHPDDCTPSVVTCVPDDDDDSTPSVVTDDSGDAPSLLHAHQSGFIAGGVLMVLLIIAV